MVDANIPIEAQTEFEKGKTGLPVARQVLKYQGDAIKPAKSNVPRPSAAIRPAFSLFASRALRSINSANAAKTNRLVSFSDSDAPRKIAVRKSHLVSCPRNQRVRL